MSILAFGIGVLLSINADKPDGDLDAPVLYDECITIYDRPVDLILIGEEDSWETGQAEGSC